MLEAGKFAVTCELGPPKGCDAEEVRELAQLLRGNVDAANVTDNQTAVVRMSSIGAATLMLEEGLEPVMQMVTRDRNRIAIQSDILGAAAVGIKNILCLTGDHHSLGDHPQSKAVWDVDRRLAQVSNAFDFILQVTPTNADAAWAEFRRRRFEVAPEFTSRPLKLDTALAKRELFKVPIERVEDPTLAQLFRDQQVSLDRKLTMLGDRGRREFVYGSLQVFGGVDEPLLTLAYEVLNRVPSRTRGESRRGAADARALAARADEELDRYREQDPEMTGGADIRKDVVGAMVSRGRLLIGASIKVPAARVEALLAHEVGTHIVTYVNGKAQPFRQLALGLPAYDELQEGLAVFAEYLVGGFSRPRLRLLAARVLAIHRMLDGADFVEVFRELDRAHDFEQRTAFNLTMRAFRGGGLTKDVVYLRGLVRLLRYLREGGSIETLTVGKLGLDHVPIIEELQWRKILRPPPLRPRWLDDPVAQQRLQAARQGITVLDLAKEGRK